MFYTANEIARYVITYCNQQDIPISNLKLQKVLYYLWIEYFNQQGRPLFQDDICAWQLGPVIPNVYFEYCAFGGLPIHREYPNEVLPEDSKLLDKILAEYCNISASRLVDMSHEPGGAWDYIYNRVGNKAVIPYDLIKLRECN